MDEQYHDKKGRFKKGNPGGGRPSAVDDYLAVFRKAAFGKDNKQLIYLAQSLVKDAIDGDKKARETVLKLGLPKPEQTIVDVAAVERRIINYAEQIITIISEEIKDADTRENIKRRIAETLPGNSD